MARVQDVLKPRHIITWIQSREAMTEEITKQTPQFLPPNVKTSQQGIFRFRNKATNAYYDVE